MLSLQPVQSQAPRPGEASPESLIDGLTRRLRNHRMQDSLLLFAPVGLVCLYLGVHLYRAAWITQSTFIIVTIGMIGIGILALILGFRRMTPSVRSAARMIDEKATAEDRFLTLATVERSWCSHVLLGRLRQETSGLLGHIDLRRDFPYEIKRSFYWSLIASMVAILLLHVLLPMPDSMSAPLGPRHQLSQVAEKMAQRPGLQQLARDLQSLATKLQDPDASRLQKQQAIQQMQKKIEEQQNQQAQKDNQDALAEAASSLKEIAEGSENGQRKQQETGGGLQSNLPEGQGETKQSQGSGGDTKGDVKTQNGAPMEQGKAAQADPKQQGEEKNQSAQAGQENDKNQPGEEQGKEMKGKTEGGSEEKLGKSRLEGKGRSEENPQGAPPAERFTKPGEEGKGGLKGARYVTVQLPEELAAEGKAQSGATREGKEAKVRPKVPISNVPLPAHVPDAPSEKQHLPLEYRGVIR
jgi:hypothetical protein